jgi:hypothetical protein
MSNQKREYENIIKKIDTSQLVNSTNKINPENNLEDKPTDFTEKEVDNRDFTIDNFPEFTNYVEARRFARKVPINDKKIRIE